jgi:NhaP-type Na+/H+ or K+/H+ antiporter
MMTKSPMTIVLVISGAVWYVLFEYIRSRPGVSSGVRFYLSWVGLIGALGAVVAALLQIFLN